MRCGRPPRRRRGARRCRPAQPELAAAAVKPKALVHSIVLAWGWRRVADRLRRRRVVGAGDGAAQRLAGSVPDLSGPGLADRRRRQPGRWGGITVAATTGWWFGFGYFLAGLYWIGFAFLVDAPTFGWLLPFAVIGLPAMLAIFTALGVALARLLWTRGALAHPRSWRGADRNRMAARPCADRISLERLRLCAHRAAGAGAERRADRHLGPHLHRDRVFASPATLIDDRAETRWPWLPLALAVAVLAGARRLRRVAARAHADAARRRRASAHHAAEPAAGRALQLRRQAARSWTATSRCPTAPRARNRTACAT